MERSDRPARPRRVLSAVALPVVCVLVVGAGLRALPSRATVADTACPPQVSGTLANVSRPIVPIGVSVIRGFTVTASGGATVSGVQLTAPPEYKAKQIPANKAFGLRFTAPRAGAFLVQATWSESYVEAGATLTCSASGSSTLTAARGTPLKVVPPPARKFPPADHVSGTQYDSPLVWTWKCKADSDPTPLDVTLRWEFDPRPLPLFSKGGNAPFRFSSRAKTLSMRTGDSCDVRQAAGFERKLVQGATLKALAGGDVGSGNGLLYIRLKGGFRNAGGNTAPFHLGVTLRQGSRTLVQSKLCAWEQSSFLLARGKGISCWW